VAAPAKTSTAAIVAAARAILEAEGPSGVTMQAVAAAVGIRGPSLYKRFPERSAILAEIEFLLLAEIEDVLVQAAGTAATPRGRIEAMARAHRAYAKAHPQGYALIFGIDSVNDEAHLAARAAAIRPVLAEMRALAGTERALLATRTVTAWLHGFVSIEQAGLFRLGGDIDAAFGEGLATLLDGIASRAAA
jgi:AcrR family transcriptional regulator